MQENEVKKREEQVLEHIQANDCSKGESFSKNRVELRGIIEANFCYSHTASFKQIYKTRVEIINNNGYKNYVPIFVSEDLIQDTLARDVKGKFIEVRGTVRSHNWQDEYGKNHVDLFVWVDEVNICDTKMINQHQMNQNDVYLKGEICKIIGIKETRVGLKFTCLLRVTGERKAYVPCIAWREAAQYAAKLQVGDKIDLCGIFQSREYFKKILLEPETREYRTTYEVNIRYLNHVEN